MSKLIFELLKLGIAGIVGYFLSFAVAHRTEQVTRVNNQLDNLYGSLLAELMVNKDSWEQFKKTRFPERATFFDSNPRSKQDIEVWRKFMQNTFQPQNEKMSHIISKNVALFADGRIPNMFNQIIVHTEAYKSVMANWKWPIPDDPNAYTRAENTTLVNFPDPKTLLQCLNEQIDSLKTTRDALENPIHGLISTIAEKVPDNCDKMGSITR